MDRFKFRAWNKLQNKMFHNVGIHPHLMMSLMGEDDFYAIDTPGNFLYTPNDENIILMQCTGLKDKNGVEIYEGDFVKTDFDIDGSHESIQVIEFYEGSFGSRNRDDHFRIPALFSGRATEGMNLNYYQVIGNIHQNPEISC